MISPSYSFVAGDRGSWEVMSINPVIGECLEPVPYMDIRNEYLTRLPVDFRWLLRGVSGNQRYVSNFEQAQAGHLRLHRGKSSSNLAAFIPVKKKQEWWDMTEKDRRGIFEEKSQRIRTGLKYLPAVARKLHHSRDLGEPFDYLTWFEYGAETANAFEELVAALRETEEWKYVEREVDVRLVKSALSLAEF